MVRLKKVLLCVEYISIFVIIIKLHYQTGTLQNQPSPGGDRKSYMVILRCQSRHRPHSAEPPVRIDRSELELPCDW